MWWPVQLQETFSLSLIGIINKNPGINWQPTQCACTRMPINIGGGGPSPLFPLLALLLLYLINCAGEALLSLDFAAAVEGNGVALVLAIVVVGLLAIHWFDQSLPSFRLSLGVKQDDSDGFGLGTMLLVALFAVLYYSMWDN